MAAVWSPPRHVPLQENLMASNREADAQPPVTDVAPKASRDPKKRKALETENGESKKRKDKGTASPPLNSNGVVEKNCHQCHSKRDKYLQCTVLKTKGKKAERCGGVYCQSCLARRYEIDMNEVLAAGRPTELSKVLGHIQTDGYVWKCPACSKTCNCHVHRKEYGLPLTGSIEKLARETGKSASDLLSDPVALEAAKQAKKENDAQRAAEKAKAKEDATKAEAAKLAAVQAKATMLNGPVTTSKPENKTKIAKPVVTTEKPGLTKTNGSAAPSKLPPRSKPFVKHPLLVEPPNFEFIAISHPLSVVQKRLRVREFVLRFEKQLTRLQHAALPGKYIKVMNDPNESWTDLNYRKLLCSLFNLIGPDNTVLDSTFVKEGINQINKTQPDSPEVWNIAKSLLEGILEVEDLVDFSDEDTRLELIMSLLDLAVGSSLIRHQIDSDLEKQKEIHKASHEKLKQLKANWEEEKSQLQKDRVLLKVEERQTMDERYVKAFNGHKRVIALEEQDTWFACRKLACRTTPLGMDPKGNVYHQFIQREKDWEDWGQWVVVERAADLPHPSGVLPKINASSSDETTENQENEEQQQLDVSQEDEDTIQSRVWYAVSTAADIRHLADWIKYEAELVWYKATMADQQRTHASTPMKASNGGSSGILTPHRQIMTEVRVPPRTPKSSKKLSPEELMSKESIESLVHNLRKIASFRELDESDPRFRL